MNLSHEAVELRNRRDFVKVDTLRRMCVRLAAVRNDFGERVTFAALLYAVAVHFEMNAAVLMGPSREGPIVRARHALVWIARNRLGASYPNIGRYLARDHTTILHGARRAEILRAADPAFAAIVARVEFELWPGASA